MARYCPICYKPITQYTFSAAKGWRWEKSGRVHTAICNNCGRQYKAEDSLSEEQFIKKILGG